MCILVINRYLIGNLFIHIILSHRNTANIKAFFFHNIGGIRCIRHFCFNLPAVGGVPEADINHSECICFNFSLLKAFAPAVRCLSGSPILKFSHFTFRQRFGQLAGEDSYKFSVSDFN